jgi:hypothetical protein
MNLMASVNNRTVVLKTADDGALRMVKNATTTERRRPPRTRGEFPFNQNI